MKRVIVTLVMALFVICAVSSIAAAGSSTLRVLFVDVDGNPIKKADINELYCADMGYDPVYTGIKLGDGYADIEMTETPVQITALFKVPGFGEVHVYADNKGRGYSTRDLRNRRAAPSLAWVPVDPSTSTINFVTEAIQTRQRRVYRTLMAAKAEGVPVPKGFSTQISVPAAVSMKDAYAALAKAMTEGEQIVLEIARYRISQYNGPRKEFLFGCNAFGLEERGPLYQKYWLELFNFGTANMYLTHFAPKENVRTYAETDLELNWIKANGKTAKTCPPVYLANGVTPTWMRGRSYFDTLRICRSIMYDAQKHYAGKVPVVEITNEADMSTCLDLNQDGIIAFTKVCSEAAREADPQVRRIINSAHLWGEFAAKLDKDGKKKRAPLKYLQDCIKAGIEFEIVGLQMYYPDYDLLEIDRMLERYATLGKTIQITEMGCSSAPGLDPNAQRQKTAAGWHGDWTEEMQADWVESVYTLYYSKPYIDAASWWDLADAVSFWPYGGMLKGDCTPKQSYTRLKNLIKSWGFTVGGSSSSPDKTQESRISFQ